jgi:hypothetical protein
VSLARPPIRRGGGWPYPSSAATNELQLINNNINNGNIDNPLVFTVFIRGVEVNDFAKVQ